MSCCDSVPPDLDRCQGMKQSGNTTGGKTAWARCSASPTWIATELEPGPDGMVVSVSLCEDCKQVFEKQPDAASRAFEKI